MKEKTRYKFLRKVGKSIKSYSGNEIWEIGQWKKIDGKVKLFNKGFHCSKGIYQAFSYVHGEILAKVEVKGSSEIWIDQEVYSEMRIIKAWEWTKKDFVALAIHSAELVLENYEKIYPNDMRPRKAIEAAKKVLSEDTAKNRSAARSAAWSAMRNAMSAASSTMRSAISAMRSAMSAEWSESSAISASTASSTMSTERSAISAVMSAPKKVEEIEKWMNDYLINLREI